MITTWARVTNEACALNRAMRSAASGSFFMRALSAVPESCAPFSGALVMRFATRATPLMVIALGVAACLLAWAWPPALPVLAFHAAVASVAWRWPAAATAMLPLAMIWAPRLAFASWAGETPYLRVDHALVLGAAWRTLRAHAWPEGSRIHAWGALCLSACAISITMGIYHGTLPPLPSAPAYLAQLAYIGLAFTLAHAYRQRLGNAALWFWFAAGVSVAGYGLAESLQPLEATSSQGYRTFERGWFPGQANHIGGLLAMTAVASMALAREHRFRAAALLAAALAILALPGAGSRQAIAALAVGLAAWRICRAPRQLPPVTWLFAGMLILFLAIPFASYFSELARPGGSLHDRFTAWRAACASLPEHPCFGLGLGARHRSYYDNQYVHLLAECGIAGLVCFMALLLALARSLWRTSANPGLNGSIATAAFCALAAWTTQGLASSCFIITALAGPLACLAGYAVPEKEPSAAP